MWKPIAFQCKTQQVLLAASAKTSSMAFSRKHFGPDPSEFLGNLCSRDQNCNTGFCELYPAGASPGDPIYMPRGNNCHQKAFLCNWVPPHTGHMMEAFSILHPFMAWKASVNFVKGAPTSGRFLDCKGLPFKILLVPLQLDRIAKGISIV